MTVTIHKAGNEVKESGREKDTCDHVYAQNLERIYTHLSCPLVQSGWNRSSDVAYAKTCAVEPVSAHPDMQDPPGELN